MIHLPIDLQYEIMYYVCNETILQLPYVCKQIDNVMGNALFKEYILYRYHPMVFNMIDNFCRVCNLQYPIVYLNDDCSIQCKHI